MARGEEYKRLGVVFIGKTQNGEKFTEAGASPARQRAGSAPETLLIFPKCWVLSLINTYPC